LAGWRCTASCRRWARRRRHLSHRPPSGARASRGHIVGQRHAARTGADAGAGAIEDSPAFGAGAHFSDRRDAGRRLAARLERFRGARPVVVGIPRGGVPVAAEVARALDAPLDVVLVRKVGAPRNREFAIGAVAEGGVRMLSAHTVRALGISARDLEALTAGAERELAEELGRYRGGRAPRSLSGRTVVVVDDGLATGRSARAAIAAVSMRGAARVVLAVPVAAPESARELCACADDVVCVQTPPDMWAVGLWYEDFSPTGDAELVALLAGGIHSGQ